MPFALVVERVEGDAAARQDGVVFQRLPAQFEHHVRVVEVLLDIIQHVIGSHLHAMQRVVDMQDGALQGLRRLAESLLLHHLT